MLLLKDLFHCTPSAHSGVGLRRLILLDQHPPSFSRLPESIVWQ